MLCRFEVPEFWRFSAVFPILLFCGFVILGVFCSCWDSLVRGFPSLLVDLLLDWCLCSG